MIRVQLHSDCRRTLTRRIVGIIPGLLNEDTGGCRGMRVGHIDMCIIITRSVTVCGRHFLDCILDFFSILILVEVAPAVGPAVCFRYGLALTIDLHAIRIQVYRDLTRSLTILVIIIYPCLRSAYTCLFRYMCVRHVDMRIIITRSVTLYRRFLDCISDRISILILVEIAPAVCPAICFRYGLALTVDLHAIRIQVYRD